MASFSFFDLNLISSTYSFTKSTGSLPPPSFPPPPPPPPHPRFHLCSKCYLFSWTLQKFLRTKLNKNKFSKILKISILEAAATILKAWSHRANGQITDQRTFCPFVYFRIRLYSLQSMLVDQLAMSTSYHQPILGKHHSHMSVGPVSTTHSSQATDLFDNAFRSLTTLSGHYGVLKNAQAMIGKGIYYCNVRNGLHLQEFPKSNWFTAKSHPEWPKKAK